MRRLACIVAVIALGLPGARPARAAPDTSEPTSSVLVTPLHVQGDVGEGWAADFEEGLARGLGRTRAEVLAADADTACSDDACWLSHAERKGATFVVRGHVAADDRDFDIRIDLLSVADGRVVATARQPCDLCGLGEVSRLVEDVAASVASRLDALASSAAVIAFESAPPGAEIRLDGEPIGTAPLSREVAPGSHRAEASLRDHVSRERTFEAEAGVDQTLRFELAPAPRDRRRYRPLGWAALGGGAAAAIAGGVLLGIDERDVPSRCTGDNVNPLGICKYRYDTLGGGAALLAAGGALLVTGVVILVVTRRKPSARTSALPGGIRVRF